ncbi:MAG: ABC transporter permease [Anaerolineales bacterium]|nr:ABC transporter permease [Anaerolineales bacterium]
MKRILDITFKDLIELTRNRMTFLFLLIMPIAFTVLFGFAFSGGGSGPEDPRLPVGFLNLDGELLSLELTGQLEASTVFRLVVDPEATPEGLEQQVADGDLAAAIVIPAGSSQAAVAGDPVPLTVFVDPSAISGMTIEGDLQAAANRMNNAILTARIVVAVSGEDSAFEPALGEALAAWENPPIRVNDTTSVPAETGSGSQGNSFTHTAPGMMLQFAIAGLITAAQVMVSERKNRCLQRILTTATSRLQILLGHYLAIVILLLGQFILLIVFGQLALKLDYLNQAGATLLVMLTTALCIGGLGLLIGVLARTEEQAIMFSLLPMFILSSLGGAWVPLEITGPTFSAIGHVSPVAWSLDGFQNILARGLGLESVLLPSLALAGYAVLFFLLAAWRFRRASA